MTVTLLAACFVLAGCAGVKDSLNAAHQDIMESAKDSKIAIHEGDVKPIPESSFEPRRE